MTVAPQTQFSAHLAQPEYVSSVNDLAAAFVDQTVYFRLENIAASAPNDFGAHLRRSFLGGLGVAASEAAKTGAPCTWDPPCTLDVFCREQFRTPRGDGLPKPYVVGWARDGHDLIVSLRVFGMALDWFMAAVDGFAYGLRHILPWARIFPGRKTPPRIVNRWIDVGRPESLPLGCELVALKFLTPLDISNAKTDPLAAPYGLISKLLRRADAMARWHGFALSDEVGRALALHLRGLEYEVSGLQRSTYHSPNAKKQKRAKQVVEGRMLIRGDLAPILPVLAIGARCHMGRGAVEGLGCYTLHMA